MGLFISDEVSVQQFPITGFVLVMKIFILYSVTLAAYLPTLLSA
jgi:hypothetical protein